MNTLSTFAFFHAAAGPSNLASPLFQVSTFFLFRDLADLSQFIIEPPRSSTIATWRYQNFLSLASLSPLALGGMLKMVYPAVCSWPLFLTISGWTSMLFYSGVINPHVMMRARWGRRGGAKIHDGDESICVGNDRNMNRLVPAKLFDLGDLRNLEYLRIRFATRLSRLSRLCFLLGLVLWKTNNLCTDVTGDVSQIISATD